MDRMPRSSGTAGPRKEKPRAPRRRPDARAPAPPGAGSEGRPPLGFRDRLRRDPFLFALCLGFLAFTTWALAVSWRLLGDSVLLVLAVVSTLPAFYLFYLRDGKTA